MTWLASTTRLWVHAWRKTAGSLGGTDSLKLKPGTNYDSVTSLGALKRNLMFAEMLRKCYWTPYLNIHAHTWKTAKQHSIEYWNKSCSQGQAFFWHNYTLNIDYSFSRLVASQWLARTWLKVENGGIFKRYEEYPSFPCFYHSLLTHSYLYSFSLSLCICVLRVCTCFVSFFMLILVQRQLTNNNIM